MKFAAHINLSGKGVDLDLADGLKKTRTGSDASRLYKVSSNKEWGNGLGKRTAKNSVKTVFFNFKEYISFFVALFIIQSMFWMICFTASTNITHRYNVIKSQYDYDMLIEGIDLSERAAIENALYIKSFQYIRSYESYEFSTPDAYHDYYSLKVSLKPGHSAETFISYYIDGTGVGRENVSISYTPRYEFMEDYLNATMKNGVLAAVFLTVLSVVLLMALYNVRINHYKFLYGIYMTCGAGFKKLFSTAKWEMFVISATTLLASFFSVFATLKIAYGFAGVSDLHITWWMIPSVIMLNFITVYFAVRTPMKHMANKPPIALIAAQDNSNLVSSPRRSFKIFNKSFPYHYELFSTWRFRRYILGTLVTAIIFTSLFICGIYAAHMNKTDSETSATDAVINVDYWDIDMQGGEDADFGVADAVDLMDEIMTGCIDNVDGVKYSLWLNKKSATEIISHILLRTESLSGNSNYAATSENVEGYEVATNYVNYTAFDRHYIDTICSLYDVEGDPYAVLEDSGKIIISDSIYNTKNFNIKPGDKVYAAQFLFKKDRIDEVFYDNISYLRVQLERYAFDYKEYEVAAVVHASDGEGYMTVGMNYGEFLSFTGMTDLSRTVQVMLDSSVTQSEADKILNEIDKNLSLELGDYRIGYTIQNEYTALKRQLASEGISYQSIIIISVMLLLLSPVVWFFSQVLFYMKREKEISLLCMFGAQENQLRGVYTFAGIIMAGLAMAATVLLSLAASYIMFKLFNQILPSFGFTGGTRYDFYLSGAALLISIAVSAVCGFISSYIPYSISRRRRETGYVSRLSEQN